MKKSYTNFALAILFSLAFVPGNLLAQTTVFTEDFNRNENPFGTTGGTPAMTWTKVTTGQGNAVTQLVGGNNYQLAINNGATSSVPATLGGRTYIFGSLATFLSPFNTKLASNTNDIIWTFNIRGARPYGDNGFGDTDNGYAVVLCATGQDFMTADGYAVTLKKGTSLNAVRLEKFTGGMGANTNFTTVIGPSFDVATTNGYFSVKVIYTPSTNTWKLYARNDGTGPTDPNGGTTPLSQVGDATVESSLTNTTMSNFGFFVNISSTSWNSGNNKGNFDNFKVVVDNISTAVNTINTGQSLYVLNGRLVLSEGDVYDCSGKKVASVRDVKSQNEIPLQRGIYFVKTLNGTTKVYMK